MINLKATDFLFISSFIFELLGCVSGRVCGGYDLQATRRGQKYGDYPFVKLQCNLHTIKVMGLSDSYGQLVYATRWFIRAYKVVGPMGIFQTYI